MADISPIYEILGVVTDFFPVILILGLVLFGLRLIMYMSGANKTKIGRKLDFAITMALPIGLGMALILSLGAAPASAAVSIKINSVQVVSGSVVTLECAGLTAGSEYTIWTTNDAITKNVTFTATQTTQFVPYPLPEDSDGAFTINIAASTSGIAASATDSVYVVTTDAGGFLDPWVDLAFSLMVPIIILVILVGLAVGLVKSFAGKEMQRSGGKL